MGSTEFGSLIMIAKEEGIRTRNKKYHQIFSELSAYLRMIREGFSFNDKLVIAVYFCLFPLRMLWKVTGKEYKRTFLRPVTIHNRYGNYYCDRSFNNSRIVSTFYEKELEPHFELNEGVFVDVGAHIGKYSVRIAKKIGPQGRVVSIEPEPYNFSVLEKNIKLNGLSNVSLHNMACAAYDGVSSFYVDSKATTLHSIYLNRYIAGGREIRVKTTRLDSLITRLKIDKVDLIKIDAEGAELSVIEGAEGILQKCHPKIIFEAWSVEYLDEIASILTPHHYRIEKIFGENYYAY